VPQAVEFELVPTAVAGDACMQQQGIEAFNQRGDLLASVIAEQPGIWLERCWPRLRH
jgi:hypothetical protein